MNEKLIRLIVETIEKYNDVRVFFDYNKNDDVYNTCITFNKSMRLTTLFENLMKLPKKVMYFECYIEIGRIEYVID